MGMEKKDPGIYQSGNVSTVGFELPPIWCFGIFISGNISMGCFPGFQGLRRVCCLAYGRKGQLASSPRDGQYIWKYRRLEDQRPKSINCGIYVWNLLGVHLCWVVATQIFFMFIPKLGEDEPILTINFFRWVGSTTNQLLISYPKISLAEIEIYYLPVREWWKMQRSWKPYWCKFVDWNNSIGSMGLVYLPTFS